VDEVEGGIRKRERIRRPYPKLELGKAVTPRRDGVHGRVDAGCAASGRQANALEIEARGAADLQHAIAAADESAVERDLRRILRGQLGVGQREARRVIAAEVRVALIAQEDVSLPHRRATIRSSASISRPEARPSSKPRKRST